MTTDWTGGMVGGVWTAAAGAKGVAARQRAAAMGEAAQPSAWRQRVLLQSRRVISSLRAQWSCPKPVMRPRPDSHSSVSKRAGKWPSAASHADLPAAATANPRATTRSARSANHEQRLGSAAMVFLVSPSTSLSLCSLAAPCGNDQAGFVHALSWLFVCSRIIASIQLYRQPIAYVGLCTKKLHPMPHPTPTRRNRATSCRYPSRGKFPHAPRPTLVQPVGARSSTTIQLTSP